MSRQWMVAAIAVVAAPACGDSTEVEDQFTKEEAISFLEGILPMAAGEGLTPRHMSEDSVVATCPLRGQVTVKVTDRERQVADTAWFGARAEVVADGCGFSSDKLDFEMDGDPKVVDDLLIRIVGLFEEVTVVGGLNGGVRWRLDDREGKCPIDLSLGADSSQNAQEVKAKYKGRMCGHEVEVEVDLKDRVS